VKTYTDEKGVMVTEYEAQDYINFSSGAFLKPGKQYYNDKTICDYWPQAEYDNALKLAETNYWQNVDQFLNNYVKPDFERRYTKSDNKSLFLEREGNACDFILIGRAKGDPFQSLPRIFLSIINSQKTRYWYNERIIQGNRDYFNRDTYFIIIEVMHQYRQFLDGKILELQSDGSIIKKGDKAGNKKTNITTSINKPTCRQYALFYYFLWQSDEIEIWVKYEGRTKWLKDKAKYHDVDKKNFVDYFNDIVNKKDYLTKTTAPNISDLKITCTLLKEYPKALQAATVALKKAKDE